MVSVADALAPKPLLQRATDDLGHFSAVGIGLTFSSPSPPNGVKFFTASNVLELAKDRTWPARMTNALNQYWQRKNAAKKGFTTGGQGHTVGEMTTAAC